ncbi:MAG: magnesium-translocating P-type ATPase, partial [Proteobacteria bacterium]|nr:magnesium-translocating P-type ATPase [Pseudomonadota bacterium]
AQEHRASRAVARLKQRLTLTAKVRRDGVVISAPTAEIVAGDVVLLSAGALVPADGVVISANGLLVSEAALTGESFPVDKTPARDARADDRANRVFLGTSVRSGVGEALVVATGRRTQFGDIAERLTAKPVETEFERSLRRFGYLLMEAMVGIVLFVLAVNQILDRPFIDSLLFSVALGLGMSPELLPAIVTVTLAAGATRLSERGVLVRQLEAIENLGGMTVFCTDKTGTLTEGLIEMTAAVDAAGQPSDAVLRYGFLNAALESGIENPLDQAIVAGGTASGLSTAGAVKCDELPYDFTRKRLSVVVEFPDGRGERLLILKGAVDSVLPLCATARTADGVIAFEAEPRRSAEAYSQAQAMEGFRLLAVATRPLPAPTPATVAAERGLCLEGFLVFLDPPKPEAVRTVNDLLTMGVQVKVVSGDSRHVVRHVAEAVGLRGSRLLTGGDLSRMSESAVWAAVDSTDLFAEVDPQQKERIVRALRRRGHCVGYLGDGINDAPALHAADVGISVDQAVDVARESADVVLLKRDLEVLKLAIEGGRRTFANTLKYISITTSANFGNMVSMALSTPILPFLPMAAKQILLNNLLSDFPSMAISGDAVDADRLQRSQRLRIRDLQRFMVVFGLASSTLDLATFALLLLVFHAPQAAFQTGWFVLSLLTQLTAIMTLRTTGWAWRSRPSALLAGGVGAVAALAVAAPYLGPVARLFAFVPLPPTILASLAGLVVGYFALNETAKAWFFRGQRPGHRAAKAASNPGLKA